MSKRPSLFATKATQSPEPVQIDLNKPPVEIVDTPSPVRSKARPPSREGKRILSVYLKPEAWKQLRMLSLNLESPTQSLGEEAINLLFEKHRLNRIA